MPRVRQSFNLCITINLASSEMVVLALSPFKQVRAGRKAHGHRIEGVWNANTANQAVTQARTALEAAASGVFIFAELMADPTTS